MERILVAMDPERTHLFAGIHALNLAKRIQAKVLFLLVFPARSVSAAKPSEESDELAMKKHVQGLIGEAQAHGIAVDYYTAYGSYESELVSFVQQNKVTLLVVENTTGPGDSADASGNLIEKLRHRINCRIEVVNEKPKTPERKD